MTEPKRLNTASLSLVILAYACTINHITVAQKLEVAIVYAAQFWLLPLAGFSSVL